MAKVISIVNQKGGTGKSACTANLAVGLVQKNMKVLIVDADPQSDVSAGFGYRDCDESNETLTALMDTVMKDEDIPSDCYIRHQAEGIDIWLWRSTGFPYFCQCAVDESVCKEGLPDPDDG